MVGIVVLVLVAVSVLVLVLFSWQPRVVAWPLSTSWLVSPTWPWLGFRGRACEILARHGERELTAEEFEEHFGHLPTDGEG